LIDGRRLKTRDIENYDQWEVQLTNAVKFASKYKDSNGNTCLDHLTTCYKGFSVRFGSPIDGSSNETKTSYI